LDPTEDKGQRAGPFGALDVATPLSSHTLLLRPLAKEDHAVLAACAADPLIWEAHPNKAMATPAGFDPWFARALADGGAYVVVDRNRDAVIGSARFYRLPSLPGAVCIGYTFLARSHWGGATNRALMTLMIDHALAVFSEVWFHINVSNLHGQAATARLGATLRHSEWHDLTTGPMEWFCYRLTAKNWRKQKAAA